MLLGLVDGVGFWFGLVWVGLGWLGLVWFGFGLERGEGGEGRGGGKGGGKGEGEDDGRMMGG